MERDIAVFVEIVKVRSNKLSFTLLSSSCTVSCGPTPLPTGTLTGSVFSSTAVTVAGAQVLIATNGSFSASPRTVLTNPAGVYSVALPAGDYYIKASKDVNVNTVFFEIGSDEIGWAPRFPS